MVLMNNDHLGSTFDEFLEAEGLHADADAVAIKRVIAYRIEQLMKEQNLTKTEMSRRMKTSRATLERLLDPSVRSVTIQTMVRAACILGKTLRITIT
jgi:predicted XRE-type DNA-binding protein